MKPEEPLRPWLDPPLDSARIARQWAGIETRLDRGTRPRWTWAAALTGAALAVGALGIGISRWNGASPDSVAVAPTQRSVLDLSDGSHITLESGAKVDVTTNEPARVTTSLQRGTARFDVKPDTNRAFTVLVGSVEVRVAGAQFQIDFDAESGAVNIEVFNGEAEVRSAAEPGEVHRVGVGGTWSSARAVVDPAPSPVPVPAPSVEATAAEAVDPAAPKPSAASTARATTPSAAPTDEARALFESANQARRRGDLARASSLYRELTRRFPSDPRAKVAALELGRLEMDHDRDPAVAEQALRQASSAEAGSSVHEDALARLVQLYSAKGDARACQVAQARYLAAYPNGVHGAQVRAACAPR